MQTGHSRLITSLYLLFCVRLHPPYTLYFMWGVGWRRKQREAKAGIEWLWNGAVSYRQPDPPLYALATLRCIFQLYAIGDVETVCLAFLTQFGRGLIGLNLSFPIGYLVGKGVTWPSRGLLPGLENFPQSARGRRAVHLNWSEPDEILSTDACLEGCGGWFLGRYFHAQFPEKLCSQKLHINALELVTIMVAVRLWAPHFHGRRMTILCDNASSVQVLNKGVTKDGFQANCLREIAFMASKNEFSIRARHVPGVENRITDLLSRWESTAQAELKLRELTKGYWLIKEKITEEIFYFTYTW